MCAEVRSLYTQVDSRCCWQPDVPAGPPKRRRGRSVVCCVLIHIHCGAADVWLSRSSRLCSSIEHLNRFVLSVCLSFCFNSFFFFFRVTKGVGPEEL